MSPRSDTSIAALVRTAAARRGRTRKCEIGIGTGGGGACLKPSGALAAYIQSSPYFDPTHTRTGWIGQPPILDRLEVVTDNGDVDTLGQATP